MNTSEPTTNVRALTGTSDARELPSATDLIRFSLNSAAVCFVLCFFTWGIIANPPAVETHGANPSSYILGHVLGIIACTVLCVLVAEKTHFADIRQRASYLLPAFAMFVIYFCFVRILDAEGILRLVLSICYNASTSGIFCITLALTASNITDRGLTASQALGIPIVASGLMYLLGTLGFAAFGNDIMCAQIAMMTLYLLVFSINALRKSASADQRQLAERCDAIAQAFALSARESEVLELLADDYTTARIAEELCISVETVKTHRKRIYAKTGVHKQEELMRLVRHT